MTRINIVPVDELVDKHLVAEYRELPRIFALVRARIEKGHNPFEIDIPKEYLLGKGHVTFFYDKLKFLYERQKQLIDEMLNRGFNVNFNEPGKLLEGISQQWCKDYNPTENALRINRERINERLLTMKDKR